MTNPSKTIIVNPKDVTITVDGQCAEGFTSASFVEVSFGFDPDLVELLDCGEIIAAPIGNRYGYTGLTRDNGAWVLTVPNYGQDDSTRQTSPEGWDTVRVSEKFAAAWLAEFHDRKAAP